MTSIGERTTDLCVWALERNGFKVEVYNDKSSLWAKLKRAYDLDEDFLRVDADIIVNRNLTSQRLHDIKHTNLDIWWWQFLCYDWYKQDTNHALSFVRQEALPALRSAIDRFEHDIRPETQASRISELYNPRRFETWSQIMGLHGYGIMNMKPVIALKANRGQSHLYDFELAKKLNEI